MRKYVLSILLLTSLGVVASDEHARKFVVTQFRAILEPLFGEGESTQPKFDDFYVNMVDQLPLQERAERALELSINRFVGAPNYVIENASNWRGEVVATPRLVTLTTAALNAPLIEIRMAGFELYLAQYGLVKSVEQVDRLLRQFASHPEKNAAGSLWAMAAIGARGIDRERIFDEIIAASESDSDTIRRGAVEALSRFGGQEIVAPLLDMARYDASSYIQERAFCGLAQTGTLHVTERYAALPGLLQTLRDPYISNQQQSWVYQALKEISTFYDVAEDPDDWEERLLEVDMLQEAVE